VCPFRPVCPGGTAPRTEDHGNSAAYYRLYFHEKRILSDNAAPHKCLERAG
jgi:hypothetical protein